MDSTSKQLLVEESRKEVLFSKGGHSSGLGEDPKRGYWPDVEQSHLYKHCHEEVGEHFAKSGTSLGALQMIGLRNHCRYVRKMMCFGPRWTQGYLLLAEGILERPVVGLVVRR